MAQPTPPAAAILAAQWSLLVLAAAAIGARFYLRLKIQRLPLLRSDILICVAWVSAVAAASFDIKLEAMGALKPNVKVTLEGYNGSPDDIALLRRLFWASSIPYFTTLYLCKAALLVLYLQLFPRFMHKRRACLWSTIILVALSYTTSIIMVFVVCLPIERHWSVDQATSCPPSRSTLLFQVTSGLNLLGDVLVFALPWLIVPGLQMKKMVKAGVYCAFLLGTINIAFCLIRFITIQSSIVGEAAPISVVDLWSSLDCNIGLIIACLPSLRPYLRGKYGSDYPYDSNSHTKSSTIRPPPRAILNGSSEPFEELELDNQQCSLQLSSHSNRDDAPWDGRKKSNGSDVELVPVKIQSC
ncbi:hypothetical protein ACJZ2D_014817 [Fusarium nematophilum]